MNLEIAGGVTHDLELGFRTGFRLDDDGQATQADSYGRPFDTETYGTGNDRVANPELRLRWSVARGYARRSSGSSCARTCRSRANSRFGLMFGLPIVAARRAGALRHGPLRPGPLLPTRRRTIVSVPLHLWIQAGSSTSGSGRCSASAS